MNIFKERYNELNKPDINNDIDELMSDTDIKMYDPSIRVVKYSELQNYKTINQLLKKKKDYIILLIEDEMNSGHFVAILRYTHKSYNKPVIEYFNSYGYKPSFELSKIDNNINNELGQNEPWLNYLLDSALDKYIVIYNTKRLQKLQNGINTCGKWCILRITLLKYRNYDLVEFINYIDTLKKKYKLSYDQIISWLVVKPTAD